MDSKNSQETPKLHLFICTNHRDSPKESCAAKNSETLRDNLKKLCKTHSAEIGVSARINQAGCLGRCSKGIAAVLYPEGTWYTGLKETDTELLFEELKETAQDLK